MTKDSTEPAAVAADIVFFGDWSLIAHDDATKTCREFTLEGIGRTFNGYAPKQDGKTVAAAGAEREEDRRSLQRRRRRRLNFLIVPVAAHLRRKTNCASLRKLTAPRGAFRGGSAGPGRQPAAGVFAAPSPAKRGAKTAEPKPLAAEFAPSRRDNLTRKPRLERGETILELQNKGARLFFKDMRAAVRRDRGRKDVGPQLLRWVSSGSSPCWHRPDAAGPGTAA